ncbi:MAG TPA: dihydroxy-acid dehydratase [Phycisphaerae bacterium]|nr:dihydroxy-acid dehydratase [Phycisphaerae bacterium]HUT60417.1 dihydroxy-acid dehydratase [Phycisphaerae bacterium]
MKRSDAVTRGPERGPHRSLLKATGLTDADLKRPLIAVVNSYTDVVPGHVHLDAVGEFVKKQVRAAGGTPILFNTIAICDGIAMGHTGMKYSLASRELIADCVESMVRAHCFDAMICITNCDKIVPGMLMAAIRLNIPTIFVSGGPMEAGVVAGRDVDLIDQFYAVAQQRVGKMSAAQVRRYENSTCPTCGSCSGMFTANSMNCLCEAIGIALPGNGTCLSTSPQRLVLCETAAKRIVKMAGEWGRGGCKSTYKLLPRNIMSRKAFENAFTLDMAMGGSSNTVLHLLAMASEAGLKFNLKDIDRISKRTPNICRIAPSETPEGRIYHMQDCHRGGGIPTILGQLRRDRPSLVHAGCMTVTGESLGRNLEKWSLRSKRLCAAGRKMYREGWKATGRSVEQVRAMYRGARPRRLPTLNAGPFDAKDVIRPVGRAFTREGGLVVLYGNIARKGAIVKQSGLPPTMHKFTGRAVICESQEDACRIILAGKVKAGDVVVIRNEGPRGGPGMQEMLAPTSYIRGMGLYEKCYVITDGRFSGGTSGPAIGHVAPEAAAGGEIGLLQTGDVIEIDIPARKLTAKVSAAEFARRRRRYRPRPPQITHGALGRYAAHATSADTGAVLTWPGKPK